MQVARGKSKVEHQEEKKTNETKYTASLFVYA